jgi:phenylalanyl-tRNA synthetase beta chain
LHPHVAAAYEIERPVYFFELNFEELVRLAGKGAAIVPPSRFPESVRDVALLAPLDLPAAGLIECVHGSKVKELEDVAIFDLYQGDRLPEGCKSIALRLRYRAADRTLTDEEVQQLHQKVVSNLTTRLGVTVR